MTLTPELINKVELELSRQRQLASEMDQLGLKSLAWWIRANVRLGERLLLLAMGPNPK